MIKYFSIISVFSFLLLNVPSCDYFFPPLSNGKVTGKDAFNYLKKHSDDKDVVLIDLRTKAEFDRSHLQNAVNIDYSKTDFPAEIEKLDRSKRYIIYDQTGKKSFNTLELMIELRFPNIHAIAGGFDAWNKEGLPLNF